MNWTLEVVHVPVTDVGTALAFYVDRVGFVLDHDTTTVDGTSRFAQLTPPGSGCSIVIGTGMTGMVPGAQSGLQLVVNDVRAARAELAGRGVEVSEVRVHAKDGIRAARDDDDLNNVGICSFSDPDGNSWVVQQITDRP